MDASWISLSDEGNKTDSKMPCNLADTMKMHDELICNYTIFSIYFQLPI